MPARFLKTEYQPPHDELLEMRKRGLPWLAASSILVIALLIGAVTYLAMRDDRGSIFEAVGIRATTSRPTEKPTETLATLPPAPPPTTSGPTDAAEQTPELSFGGADSSEEDESTEPPSTPLLLSSNEEAVVRAIEDEDMDEDYLARKEEIKEEVTPALPTTEEPMRGDLPPIGYESLLNDDLEEDEEQPAMTSTTSEPTTIPPPPTPTPTLDTTANLPFASSTSTPSLPPSTSLPYTLTTSPTPTFSSPHLSHPPSPTSPPSPSPSSPSLATTTRPPLLPISEYRDAVITATNEICADIARNVLQHGGNAVDAAVAGAFCLGGIESHAGGLGGGATMTIYQKSSVRCEVVNGREVAPNSVDMQKLEDHPRMREHGYSSVAVPGTLHALWTAYKRFHSGKLQWAELIQPTIELVQNGFPVSASLASAIDYRVQEINESSHMRDHFLPDGVPLKEGDILIDEAHADTLRKIATSRDPGHLFYRGDIANHIVHEVKSHGGFIAKSDLVLFDARLEEAVHSKLFNTVPGPRNPVLCGGLPPSSFTIVQLIVNLMGALYEGHAPAAIRSQPELFQHRLLEATKAALAIGSDFGDASFDVDVSEAALNSSYPAFVQSLARIITDQVHAASREVGGRIREASDIVSTHINVVDAHGNAVALTMSLNRPPPPSAESQPEREDSAPRLPLRHSIENIREEAHFTELEKKRTFRKFSYRGVDLGQLLRNFLL